MVTDAEIGQMIVYAGMNHSGSEISEHVGYSTTTVNKYLNQVEEESKAASDPESVFKSYVMAYFFESFRESVV